MNSFFANIGKELETNILSKSSSQPLNSHIYCVTPAQSENPTFKRAPNKVFQIGSLYWKVTSNDFKLHNESSITGLHEVVKCSVLSGKFSGE